MSPLRRTHLIAILGYCALALAALAAIAVFGRAPLTTDSGRELLAGGLTLAGVAMGIKLARHRREERARSLAKRRRAASANAALLVHQPIEAMPLPQLNPRELRVLEQLAAGHRTDEIAQLLGLSEAALKSQVMSLCHKLGARHRAGAVAIARRAGWVD